MNKLWRVGLFAKDYTYLDEVYEFTNKLIEDKDEEIEEIRKWVQGFEIITDKSLYKFIVVSEGIRGYRWHEAYVFDSWLIDSESIDGLILAKIVPYDMWNRDIQWDYRKYVHYMERN